jgi:gliding motility-associated-like protein
MRETLTQTICEGSNFLGYSLSGRYVDTLRAANGCDSIRTLNLTVLPRKRSAITQAVCEGGSYLGYKASGTYVDTLRAANGCDSIRTLNLTVLPRKTSTLTRSICQGQSFLGYTRSGTYTDTVQAANGCDSIRTLVLTVLALPQPNLGTDRSICAGQSHTLQPGSFASYLWSDGSTGPQLRVSTPGVYWVQVSNGACTGADTFLLQSLYPVPANFLPDAQALCYGEKLDVPGFSRYLWSTGQTTSSIQVKSFGRLSLQVTNSNGCTGSDTTLITDKQCQLVQIPNAFTPNGDGTNDVFRPIFGQPVTGYRFLIFNRWGQQLLVSQDPTRGWDGRWNGGEAPSGVFYYILDFQDVDGKRHQKSGSVTLIR